MRDQPRPAMLAMVTTEERISRLEGAYEQVSERLGEIRTDLARIGDRLDTMTESVNRRLDGMDARFDALHRTMLAGLGLILAAIVGLSFVQ